jgi:predicted ATPase/DNA-binding SARP family transcriptional activator
LSVVRVELLGEVQARGDDGAAIDVRGAKQRALLAVLALHRGHTVSADRLVDALWEDNPPANPPNALQAQVAQLRRSLGPASVVTGHNGYALVADVDIEEFEHLATEGRRLLAEGEPAAGAAVLRDALTLIRGEPLADFAFAPFASAERARLDEVRLTVHEARLEAELGLGGLDVLGELEALCAEYPLREHLWALKMAALYRAGRQADALRAYGDARRVLVEELGVDPGPELRRLEAMVLEHDPALDGAPSLDSTSPRPVEIGNIPAALTRFVGRQEELARVREVTEVSRLVTLVGPGGAGKTRLALEAAAAMRPGLRHGAWLVELAPVVDASGVAAAMAIALGVGEMADRRVAGAAGSTVDALIAYLSGRTLLVVLDNCEHVIGEAARVTEALLQAVPGMRIVATSREALGVPGESLLPVGPLPPADALSLFVDRARAAAPSQQVTEEPSLAEEVCRRLDGMPLAIELAAARLRALPLAQLAARLDDRFRLLTGGARTALPRHQTLRAVVDWSYTLLFSDEQRLFDRIAVFTGPFTASDAEAVCDDEQLPRADIFELLLHLVDKSLLATSAGDTVEARFTQLQTLWEYGRERLVASGEAAAMRARHAEYYRALAEDAYEALHGPGAPACRARLTAQLGNLRAALDWHIAAGDAAGAVSLATGIALLWQLNGDFAEGARWLADALGSEGPAPSDVLALGRAWHGYLVCWSSSPAAGIAECSVAVDVLRQADCWRLGEGLGLLAGMLVRNHDFERSLEVLDELRTVLEPGDRPWLMAVHDMLLAFNLAPAGRLDEAEAAARSAFERFDALGEPFQIVDPLWVLAAIAEARGDIDGAVTAQEELLERCRAAGLRIYVPFRLVRLAALRARQGDDEAADRLYDEAIGSSFNPWLTAEAMVGQAAVARRQGDLARARALLDEAERQYGASSLATGRAAVLASLAWWWLASGEPGRAIEAATEAGEVAAETHDPTMQIVANTARAAAAAIAEPTTRNVAVFLAEAARRASGGTFGSLPLPDEPDVAALAARLATG